MQNQNIIIEITDNVNKRSGISNNGQPYEIYSQEAYYHSPVEKYPQKINFNVESEQKSYPLGYYLLDTASSLNVGQYQALGFNRFMSLIHLSQQELLELQKRAKEAG